MSEGAGEGVGLYFLAFHMFERRADPCSWAPSPALGGQCSELRDVGHSVFSVSHTTCLAVTCALRDIENPG